MNKKSNDGLFSLGSALVSLGATLATSCCIVPLVLVNLGWGGAWTANLAILQPYRIYLLMGAALLTGAGLFFFIRNCLKPCAACPPQRPVRNILVPVSLAVSVLLIILALILPSIEPQLLRVLR